MPVGRTVQVRWHIALWLTTSLVAVAIFMPGNGFTWLRSASAWFEQYVLWNDATKPVLDPGHVVLFTVLGYVAGRAFARYRSVVVLAWLAVFGGASEIAQIWVPGRHARVSDFVADVLAAAAALCVARMCSPARKNQS